MRRALRLAAYLACASGLSLATAPAPVLAASPDVLLSEAYGGGGNTGAPYANDFVELYNRSGTAVSLSGWSVQYASASGTTWLVTALSGSVQAGGYFLVRLGSGGGNGAALPAPDATGGTNLSATSGKVALVTSTTALSCGSSCATAAGVRDFLGYGSANDSETAPALSLSNTTSAARANPATDTDNNSADFARGGPTPQGSSTGSCSYPGTRIRTVQGAAHLSALNGATVTDVRGVVTAVRTNGFWFQDPCPDTSAATSEGLFVFTSTAPGVAVGDEVRVNGRVSEYRSGGSTSTNLTITELVNPAVTKLGTRAIPSPTVVGTGGRVPPTTVIDNDATGSVETSGTFDPATDGIDFYESLEGMLVRVNNPVAVGPTNSFGEIPVVGDDGANAGVRTTRGGIVLRAADANPERVMLDDALLAGATPTVNTGDHFTAPATGVVDYSFGNFKLLLTSPLGRVAGPIAPETTSPPGPGQLAVATFNVENLDPGDPQSKFNGLATQIVTRLAAPGIIAVEEVQDNDGPTNSATVDAAQTWTKLINAISAAGGPSYAYSQVNPVDDADGGEPGGNIRVGFLYRPDTVSFAAGTPGDATTAVTVSATGVGADPVALSRNPGRVDPGNAAFSASRKPLVGKFYFAGRPVFVIANHFSSKGGDDPLFGRYQPPRRPSEQQRLQQAQVVAGFVNQIRAIDPQARVVVAGDLNDFEFSATVQALVGAGLTDLPATLPDSERYTYVWEGNSQVLDHIMVSTALAAAGYGYDVVHTNAELANPLSDHDPQVARLNIP
ncbi:MAG TPA: lamin tail domain-containing protein [Micromonosporaceae bacterium]|nr:lamin tail domain-containing protein [Micromonosporaceae bacterium]